MLRLQLLGLALQIRREGLGLEQQLLGPHRGVDRVEHDADRLGQLLEERPVDVAEWAQGRELDDGKYLVLEQHRDDDDVYRRRFAESARDLDVIVRRLRDQDRLLLQRSLTDESFTQLEMVRDGLAVLVSVARDQGQLGIGVVGGLGEEECAVLRGNDGGQLGHDEP